MGLPLYEEFIAIEYQEETSNTICQLTNNEWLLSLRLIIVDTKSFNGHQPSEDNNPWDINYMYFQPAKEKQYYKIRESVSNMPLTYV